MTAITAAERHQLALAAHQSGHLADAARLYAAALEADPAFGPTLHMRGMLAFQSGDLPTAIRLVQAAITNGHDTGVVWSHLGAVLQTTGQIEAATHAMREATLRAPTNGEFLFNLGLAEKALAEHTGTDLNNAINALRQAITHLPDLADAHYALGLCLQQTGQDAAAQHSYQTTLALAPHHLGAALNLGVLSSQAGDHEHALLYAEQALRSDPSHLPALNNRGLALQELGRLAEAIAVYETIPAEQVTADILNNHGLALARSEQVAWAEKMYRTALLRDPAFVPALSNLADLLHERGDHEEALAVLRRTAEAMPKDIRPWLQLAQAYTGAGRTEDAFATLQHAQNIAPDNAEVHDALSTLEHTRKQPHTALDHARRAAQLTPHSHKALRKLALAALRCQYTNEALTTLDRILRDDPLDQEALAYLALALRQSGNAQLADRLTDLDFIHVTSLPAPSDMTLEAFNTALAAELRNVRRKDGALNQSVRGGTQTQDQLFAVQTPMIQRFRAILDELIAAYLAARPSDPQHPFLAAHPTRRSYRSWSVILRDQGYHTQHIHPEGCLSGVYYVQVPPFTGVEHAGSLSLGEPGVDVPLPQQPPTFFVPPQPRRLVLFPSYMWHGVVPFSSEGERVTIAFDLCRPPR